MKEPVEWSMDAYQSKILSTTSKQSFFASKKLKIDGSMSSLKLYFLGTCPDLEVTNQYNVFRAFDTRHHQHAFHDFDVPSLSLVKFKVENATAPVHVSVFDNWEDARMSTREHAEHGHTVLDQLGLFNSDEGNGEVSLDQSGTYVFSYKGETTGTVVYDFTFRAYNTQHKVMEDLDHCSYNQCTLPMKRNARCILVQSTASTHSIKLLISVVKETHWIALMMVASVPLLVALVLSKCCNDIDTDTETERPVEQNPSAKMGHSYELILTPNLL